MNQNTKFSLQSFGCLFKLNANIYLKSVSTYIVLSICLLLYAGYTFLNCYFGVAIRVSGFPFDSQLIFVLSGVVAGNIISQYRDGFYRNKIICGNKKSACYFADYLVSLLFCWIIGILTTLIFLIMVYSINLKEHASIFERDYTLAELHNIYNNYLCLNLCSFLMSSTAIVAIITFISQMLSQRPKFAQTIAILVGVFASLIPFVVMIIAAVNGNMSVNPSSKQWMLWLCWADPFSFSTFTNDALLQLFSDKHSQETGLLLKGFNYVSASWYQMIMNLGWAVIINILGITLYSRKDFK